MIQKIETAVVKKSVVQEDVDPDAAERRREQRDQKLPTELHRRRHCPFVVDQTENHREERPEDDKSKLRSGVADSVEIVGDHFSEEGNPLPACQQEAAADTEDPAGEHRRTAEQGRGAAMPLVVCLRPVQKIGFHSDPLKERRDEQRGDRAAEKCEKIDQVPEIHKEPPPAAGAVMRRTYSNRNTVAACAALSDS